MLEIRRMREPDIARVIEIQAASPEASQWKASDYLGFETWVAEDGGELAGFLAVRSITGGEAEVLNMAVDRRWRHQGVARQMLVRVLEDRFEKVYLEVRESNAGALRFYESMGFRRAGLRPRYYERPSEAGIVMQWQKC